MPATLSDFLSFCRRLFHSLSFSSAGADADGAFLAGYSAEKESKGDFVFVCCCVVVSMFSPWYLVNF